MSYQTKELLVMLFIAMVANTTGTFSNVKLFYRNCDSLKNGYRKSLNIYTHNKREFKKTVNCWKMTDDHRSHNIVVAIVYKKTLNWFMQVLLETPKSMEVLGSTLCRAR